MTHRSAPHHNAPPPPQECGPAPQREVGTGAVVVVAAHELWEAACFSEKAINL